MINFFKKTSASEEYFTLNKSKIAHNEKYCYSIEIPAFFPAGDNVGRELSELVLYEDGTPLGKAHSSHDRIRQEGNGAYSHWENTLYFSSRDNSDPRKNNKTYSINFKKENTILSVDLNLNMIRDFISNAKPNQLDCFQLNEVTNRLLDISKEVNSSLLYDMQIFSKYYNTYFRICQKPPEILLELGPGRSGGILQFFLYSGSKNAYSVDPFPMLDFKPFLFFESLKQMNLIGDVFSFLSGGKSLDLIWKEPRELEKGKKYGIANGVLEHSTNHAGENINLPDSSVDYVYSNAVLEHVISPEETLKEIKRVLKPGGITAHQVDLRDHRDFSKPLEFLKYSKEDWEKELNEIKKHDPSNHMNRWRFFDWFSCLKKMDFEILDFVSNMEADEMYLKNSKKDFNSDYQNLSEKDAASISIFFIARKK